MPFRKTLVVAESSDGYEGFKKLASRYRLYDADYSHFSHAPSLEAAASLMTQESWTSLTYVCGDALTAEQVFDQILAFENDGHFQPCLVLSDADKVTVPKRLFPRIQRHEVLLNALDSLSSGELHVLMSALSAPTKSILVVDDNPDDLDLIGHYLHEAFIAPVEVCYATNKELAMQMMGDRHFDAVIVDYLLGPVRGTELIPEIRTHFPMAKIILCTGQYDIFLDQPTLKLMTASEVTFLSKDDIDVSTVREILGDSLKINIKRLNQRA